MNTPNTNPAPDMAVEARVQELMQLARRLHFFAQLTEEQSDADEAELETAIRAALARPQEVAEDDLRSLKEADDMLRDIGALLSNQTQFTGSYTEIVKQLLAASRAPVAVWVEPYMPSYGRFSWDVLRDAVAEATVGSGRADVDPSYHIGHQIVTLNYNSLNRIVSKFATPSAGAGGSVGAEPAVYDGVHGHPEFGAGAVPLGGGEVERLKACLKWYADGQHFILDDDWDTVSGEPQNWLNGPESGMVEDGGVARMALVGGYMVEGDGEITIELPLSEEQHTSKLARIQELMGRNPVADSADGLELAHLAGQVERHEKRVYPLQAQDAAPVPAGVQGDAARGVNRGFEANKALAQLRFFRDLVHEKRLDVLRPFEVIPPGADDEIRSHYTEKLLFNKVWDSPRRDEFAAAIDAAIAQSTKGA